VNENEKPERNFSNSQQGGWEEDQRQIPGNPRIKPQNPAVNFRFLSLGFRSWWGFAFFPLRPQPQGQGRLS